MKLWDIATGACLQTFVGHEHGIVSVSLSADNRFALSGSYDGTVKLWDANTGVCTETFEDLSFVSSACLSQDSQYIIAVGQGAKLWVLDWELEDCQAADWDEGARPYLENFLTLHTPYSTILSSDREPSQEEIKLALTRCGKPTWTEEDFQNLLYTLGCAGYGWLRPEGVRQQLEAMASEIPSCLEIYHNSLTSIVLATLKAMAQLLR
jgi:WD40 repeat protein